MLTISSILVYKILAAIGLLLIAFIVGAIIYVKRDEKKLHYMYHPKQTRLDEVADDKLEQEFWGNLKSAKIFS